MKNFSWWKAKDDRISDHHFENVKEIDDSGSDGRSMKPLNERLMRNFAIGCHVALWTPWSIRALLKVDNQTIWVS